MFRSLSRALSSALSSLSRIALLVALCLTGCRRLGPLSPPAQRPLAPQLCSALPEANRPLIVSWSATQLDDLMRSTERGGVVVRYDCHQLQLLRECSLRGSYREDGSPTPIVSQEHFKTRQQLQFRLSLFWSSLESELSDERALSLRTALTGESKFEPRFTGDAEEDLIGDCARGTHYIEALKLGAYSLESVGVEEAQGDAQLPQLGGGGGGQQETRHRLSNAGDLERCGERGFDDERCRVPFRIELQTLDELLGARHERVVREDFEELRPLLMRGDAQGQSALEGFLNRFAAHPLGNPLADEARRLFQRSEHGGQTGIEWVWFEGGSFMMGSQALVGARNERPQRRVQVPGFSLAKTEVTVGQYRRCVEAGVCTPPHWNTRSCAFHNSARRPSGLLQQRFGGEEQPVVCVQWGQARRFARWVGGDLPSEAEWEYAARSGGRTITYPWGSEDVSCQSAVMRGGGGHGCGRGATWPVCSRPQGNSAQGICDLAGSVWEWTLDQYREHYRGAPSDGAPRCSSPRCEELGATRVIRGGSWSYEGSFLRSAHRSYYSPNEYSADLGFRPRKSSRP